MAVVGCPFFLVASSSSSSFSLGQQMRGIALIQTWRVLPSPSSTQPQRQSPSDSSRCLCHPLRAITSTRGTLLFFALVSNCCPISLFLRPVFPVLPCVVPDWDFMGPPGWRRAVCPGGGFNNLLLYFLAPFAPVKAMAATTVATLDGNKGSITRCSDGCNRGNSRSKQASKQPGGMAALAWLYW